MRANALEWRQWRGVPDYEEEILLRAIALRDAALEYEKQFNGAGARCASHGPISDDSRRVQIPSAPSLT